MEKQRTIEVVKELLHHLNMNAKQFSESLGKERASWLYAVLNPELPNGLSKKIIDEICTKHPEIDSHYLITGEGSLLKSVGSNKEDTSIGANPFGKLADLVSQHSSQIGLLIEQNSKLIEQNGKLIDQNGTLIETISKLAGNGK